MGYLYDPEDLGLKRAEDPMADIYIGKAPKTSKYLNYYNYKRGESKLKAQQAKRDLQAQNKSLYSDYLYQRGKTSDQFDQQIRDLRNFASQRNWSRGSSVARQNDKIVGQWNTELESLDANYQRSKENIKNQLNYIEKQLKMELEGIAWKEKNSDEDWSNRPD